MMLIKDLPLYDIVLHSTPGILAVSTQLTPSPWTDSKDEKYNHDHADPKDY